MYLPPSMILKSLLWCDSGSATIHHFIHPQTFVVRVYYLLSKDSHFQHSRMKSFFYFELMVKFVTNFTRKYLDIRLSSNRIQFQFNVIKKDYNNRFTVIENKFICSFRTLTLKHTNKRIYYIIIHEYTVHNENFNQ